MSGTFRKAYRELSDAEQMDIVALKMLAEDMEHIINLRQSRESSLAMTRLEEAVMWAVKGITG